MRGNRLRWTALGIGFFLFLGAGLSRITFNVDILKLLPAGLPQVEGLSLFLKHFAQQNELIVTVEAKSAEAAESAADAIASAVEKRPDLVSRAVARPPWEKNPAGMAELLAFLVLNQPPEKVRAVAERMSPEKTQVTLQDTLEKLSASVSPQEMAIRGYDPFDLAAPLAGAGMMSGAQQSEFSSADGKFRVVYVEAAKPFGNYKEIIAWLKSIKRIVADLSLPGVQVGFTGEPAFVADISGSTEWDMMSSGFTTLIIIGLIFWFCYRRARPLLDLQAMLAMIFTLSLATAGLFLSQLTVIGVGCAAIMIGLSVDYGYFVYQRAQKHASTVRELQRECFQNIAWTSGTTAAAFFALNLSSLPGLSQLGNLVGMGVIIGAFVMLGIFAPLTMRYHRRSTEREPGFIERLFASPRFLRGGAVAALAIVLMLLAALGIKGPPAADFSARSLHPRDSDAYTSMERLYARLSDDRDFLSLVVSGKNEDEVLARLQAAEARLGEAKSRGEARNFRSALALWPVAANQRANLPVLAPLARDIPRLKAASDQAGFKDEAFALTENVLLQWAQWFGKPLPVWPSNETSRWILRRVASHGKDAGLPKVDGALRRHMGNGSASHEKDGMLARVDGALRRAMGNGSPSHEKDGMLARVDGALRRPMGNGSASHEKDGMLAMGMVEPVPGHEDALAASIQGDGVYLASWNQLGRELKRVIPREFRNVILGLLAILLALLALAFRSARAVGLFVATSGLVLVCLAGAMSLLGMSWNFFNLAAILLLLGTGTDYSILLLLALKRNGGNPAAAQRELGLVICLCVASASAGFGTISWANNLGLASLGQTCALGLIVDAMISVFLLPPAWKLIHWARPGASGN